MELNIVTLCTRFRGCGPVRRPTNYLERKFFWKTDSNSSCH